MDVTGLAWLEQSLATSTERVAVVVLNTPQRAAFLRKLWSLPRTAIRVAADGGANRLACTAPELTPDVVVGDMDSASPAVLRDFAARGAKVLDQHEDQDSTDFDLIDNSQSREVLTSLPSTRASSWVLRRARATARTIHIFAV